MKYVPSLPPPVIGGMDRYELRPLHAVEAARPVQPRSVPPLVFQRRTRERAGTEERRHAASVVAGERRTYCRRVLQQPMLLELRAGLDRRRHAQRSTDQAEHIDEEA
ncbi:MAG: hypothetical protein GC139_01180 [Sideroxydans sp.]|nr:hypothetical protein [Sideroxydans sp.]